MPRDPNGDYTLPVGNPVTSGTVIESTWANGTMEDLAIEMQDSLSRSGEGGMISALGVQNGALGAPGIYFGPQIQNGFYSNNTNNFIATIGNVDLMRWSSSGVQIWIGTAWDFVRTSTDHHFNGVNPDLVDADAAITIGGVDPEVNQHIAIGPTAIQSKSDGTSIGSMTINTLGGDVLIGDNLNSGQPTVQLFNGNNLILAGATIDVGESGDVVNLGDDSTVNIGSLTLNGSTFAFLRGGSIRIGEHSRDISKSGIDVNATGVTQFNNIGEAVCITQTAANGGLTVNNQMTGVGQERVLTTGDITAFLTSFIPLTTILNSGSSSFTLTTANVFTTFRMTDSDPITIFVHTNAIEPIAVGTEYYFKKFGDATTTFAPDGGVVIQLPSVTFGGGDLNMGANLSSSKLTYTGFDQWDLVHYL